MFNVEDLSFGVQDIDPHFLTIFGFKKPPIMRTHNADPPGFWSNIL